MEGLPSGFAEQLFQVLEPGDEAAVAEIIEGAIALDDDGLRKFLELFAERVRSSAKPIRKDELRNYLRMSMQGGRGGGL